MNASDVYPSLYSLTGDIKDINTLLVPAAQLEALKAESDELKLFVKGDYEAAAANHVPDAGKMVADRVPAVGETMAGAHPFPARIMDQLQEIARREDSEHHGPWTDGDGEPLQDDADAAIAWIKAAAKPPHAAPVAQLSEPPAQPRLKVRLTAFPESNGKCNWTALLVREGQWDGLVGNCGGISLARGEMWNRVAWAAECARFLIGERDTEPFILDYGDDIKTPEEWKGEVGHAAAPTTTKEAA